MRHLLDPEDRGVRRAREQCRKWTRPRCGERVEAGGGRPADPEDAPSTQERADFTERETAHMRAERPDRGGLPSKSQQGTVVETGKVRNREYEMPPGAEDAGNLGHGQPDVLEVLEDLVADHQVDGLIRPREPIPFQIHHRNRDAAPGRLRRGILEDFDAVGARAAGGTRILDGRPAVPAADIEQGGYLRR